MRALIIILLSASFCGWTPTAAASEFKRKHTSPFVQRMVAKHGFKAKEVEEILDSAENLDEIKDAMDRPAEKLEWYRYRAIFMGKPRIDGGAEFLHQHSAALMLAEEKYGVPAEVIVAIIGVETLYGQRPGKFRVLDALATLSFDYPKRASFFSSELEQFLVLCREEKLKPTEPLGSYAGAMGLPQFMPSSYRHYAVDFNDNGRRDLWNEPEDIIGSVGNYLSDRGWRRGELIAGQVRGSTNAAEDFKPSRLEPLNRFGEIVNSGVKTDLKADHNAPAGILELEGENDDEYWIGLKNFFVITTYNRSPLYAMAVFQLSQAIRDSSG